MPASACTREAVLSQVLPDEVGYLTLIQHGGETGSDWLVVTWLLGVPPSRAWPEMSVASRRVRRPPDLRVAARRAPHGLPPARRAPRRAPAARPGPTGS
ncbi:MAG: hypothetical protein R2711_14760 [Acidimicrobiales bacterium]